MPSRRNKSRGRSGWTDDHRLQLVRGNDYLGTAWGDAVHPPAGVRPEDWPTPEIAADMRMAWEHFGGALLEEYRDKLERPWAWWKFDAPPEALALLDSSPYERTEDREADALDRAGLLSPEALAIAGRDKRLTAGVLNDAHQLAFRRQWGWWRFTSPERRDYSRPEALQLVELERRGGEVLTAREKHIVANRVDPSAKSCAAKVFLTAAEVAALRLPKSFIGFPEEDVDGE